MAELPIVVSGIAIVFTALGICASIAGAFAVVQYKATDNSKQLDTLATNHAKRLDSLCSDIDTLRTELRNEAKVELQRFNEWLQKVEDHHARSIEQFTSALGAISERLGKIETLMEDARDRQRRRSSR